MDRLRKWRTHGNGLVYALYVNVVKYTVEMKDLAGYVPSVP